MTLADRITLARLFLAPLAIAGWLLLPLPWAFWACGWVCALAEFTDWLDGRVARARGEVSDFGKLADPFCDVLYRMSVMLVLCLPAGWAGFQLAESAAWGQLTVVTGPAATGTGLMPWIPVFIMVLRELLAGALRAMCASKGLVLAARASGKLKAWLQGFAIILPQALYAFWVADAGTTLLVAGILAWVCAAVSVYSIVEYIWVNRAILRQLAERRPAP